MERLDYEAALAGCARGDAAALRKIYDRDGGFLLGVARRIVRRDEVAADVLHDSFLDIWQRSGTFDPTRGDGRAWVVSVVRHRALKAVRREGRERPLEADAANAMPDDGPDGFALLAGREEASALHRCLEALEASRRAVILLAYVDGLSQSEIAARLATPLGTVKAWTRRSLLSLRDCLA